MEIIGKALKSKKRKAVPWWNNECGAAIKESNNAFRKVKSTFAFCNIVWYRKTQAKVQRTRRVAKRNIGRIFATL